MAYLLANYTRTAAATAELVISPRRCILFGIYPELTTTGTLTLRDTATAAGGTAVRVCAIGLLQAGLTFGTHGMVFNTGLTIQQSVGTDVCTVVWAALP